MASSLTLPDVLWEERIIVQGKEKACANGKKGLKFELSWENLLCKHFGGNFRGFGDFFVGVSLLLDSSTKFVPLKGSDSDAVIGISSESVKTVKEDSGLIDYFAKSDKGFFKNRVGGETLKKIEGALPNMLELYVSDLLGHPLTYDDARFSPEQCKMSILIVRTKKALPGK